MQGNAELERLLLNSFPTSEPYGLLVEVTAVTDFRSLEVLDRIKELLRRIIDCELSFDDELADWKALMPAWFLGELYPPLSTSDAKRLLQSPGGFDRLSDHWTLDGFLHWFRPENRSWYWWYGEIESQSKVRIFIEVDGYPFAWGALKFLVKAAGAQEVSCDVE